jgi:hypothetical protein
MRKFGYLRYLLLSVVYNFTQVAESVVITATPFRPDKVWGKKTPSSPSGWRKHTFIRLPLSPPPDTSSGKTSSIRINSGRRTNFNNSHYFYLKDGIIVIDNMTSCH